MDRRLPKDILGAVNKKTGKRISEGAIKKIAGGISPDIVKSETQIRQLVKQVSAMAGVPVSEDTVKEIVGAVKRSGMSLGNLESLVKMMAKK